MFQALVLVVRLVDQADQMDLNRFLALELQGPNMSSQAGIGLVTALEKTCQVLTLYS